MQVITTDDGMTIINDAYNANPASMRAALDTLVGMKASRHVVIAGQMAELADFLRRTQRNRRVCAE